MAARTFYGWRLLGASGSSRSSTWRFRPTDRGAQRGDGGGARLRSSVARHDRRGLPRNVGLPGPLVAMSVNRLGVRDAGDRQRLPDRRRDDAGDDRRRRLLAVFAFGLLVGIGVATGAIIAAQAGVARWFLRRRALALSILYSGGAIGGFIAPPILSAITTHGPRPSGVWLVAGGGAVGRRRTDCHRFRARATVRSRAGPDGLARAMCGTRPQRPAPRAFPPSSRATDWTYREALQGPLFWAMLTPFVGVSAGFALFLGHGLVI